jgi:poly(3-hydroxybutyrate) depolymerase
MSLLGAITPASERDQLPPGPGMLRIPAEKIGANDDPMSVYVHRPARWTKSDRIVIVMHGTNRDADRYRDEWKAYADEYNLLLVVPEFSRDKFPDCAYNFGNVGDDKRGPNSRKSWTFGVIDRVFAEAKARSGAQHDQYSLFGHSAGSQFVHRYLIFAKATKADVIVAANAGSYTMPTQEILFPWGLKGTDITRNDLGNAFARNVVILLGDQDIDPNHSSLPRDPQAMAQGPHRFARGQRFFATAKATAEELELPFRWRLEVVPGVGHSNKGMSERAAALIAAGGS